MSRKRRGKRDLTFPLVLGILLLFPFAVDEMFVRLKQALHASGGFGGLFDVPDLRANVHPLRPSHCRSPGAAAGDPSWPDCNGSRAASAEPGRAEARFPARESSGLSGIAALAALEQQQWEQLRAQRAARGEKPERTEAVEPMPSNPSRYFPEPRHPRLSSGVPLSTSPDDPHWVDPPPREPPKTFTSPAKREIASVVDPAPAPLASPALDKRPDWPHYAPRPAVKHEETAKAERLIEVCGRMVRESQAASALSECAPQAPEKPKEEDEAGASTILMP